MPDKNKLRLLPLFTGHAKRSSMTCEYKCANACFHEVPNTSDNAYFGDILNAAVSRRGMLRATAVVGVAGAVAGSGAELAAADPGKGKGNGRGTHKPGRGHQFDAVAPNTEDAIVVPEGYEQDIVIRWGDPLFSGVPEFDIDAQTAAAQRQQFGYNNDFLGVFPLTGHDHLLCVNHEYTNEEIMFRGYSSSKPTKAQVEISWAAHGLSVVAVRGTARTGQLTPILDHELNRRFHTNSPFEVTGPAAGHADLKTSADPQGKTVLGTLSNCSGGLTPWGTWLTAEENWHGYFANSSAVTEPTAAARLKRYGVPAGATGRKWEKFDKRFDVAQEPNEVNRFGWVVEIDPFDPNSTPKKRTMLGRTKHEAAQPLVDSEGHVAVYSGDDERFDYLYKFVSSEKMAKGNSAAAKKHNATLLDHGTLYVAKFAGDSPREIDGDGSLPNDGEFDGVGQWIALCTDKVSYVDGFTVEEVLIYTRLAADAMGATKMDRPEDVEPHPETGTVYIACTNNTARTEEVDEANPRKNNKHGHIIELDEDAHDPRSTTFTWRIFLLAGDPEDPGTYFAGFDKSQVSPISCPDNVAFDEHGNLWISTDGNALGTNDGLFKAPVTGDQRGHVQQFLSVPQTSECCGPYVSDDRILVCVQHPGEETGSSVDSPASHWPDGGSSVPRPSVAVAWKSRGR
ncbi:PhoX family protein [Propionibacteriaceae bacterium Y1700]|uniref:PhoX family protein n=1 Tax=Microlunatus sp. Y1700 TaxID=3418487 RepID=UPI003DA76F96